MKRTHLPLNGLRVLDAAARHLSFTRAADELAVTPAAVGQQIRALEDMLGVVLFRRTSKGLELTAEAAAGLEPLREGFLRFEEAVQAMQAGQSSHVYTIACPGDLLGLWLGPRLAAFRRDHPQVRFAVLGGENPPDFTEANLDLAIRLGEGPGELEGAPIGGQERVIVAPRDVALGSDGGAPWIAWPGDALPGGEGEEAALFVADAGLAIAAAAAGLGRARVPALLAEAALAAGQAIALGARDDGRRGYWLVAPTPQWRQKKVRALVAHLTASLP
jgi:LysR family transcriptional regulator, glycine cleavage system transcriptional activator